MVKAHGLQYLLAATVLTGWVKLGALMRFVSRSVVTGFVNALAILIFMAQLPELIDRGWQVHAMTAAGLAIIYGLPCITKAVPSPRVTIVVLTGVLLSGFFFANKIAHILLIQVQSEDEGQTRSYEIYGQVFFASAERFFDAFDFDAPQRSVRIDLSHAHFWDITAVNALDKVVLKFRRKGCEVEVLGLNQASATLVDKFGVHDKDTADNILKGH